MKKWLLLGGVIASEVTATLSLRAAIDQPAWTAVVVAGYLLAFVFLGLTLREGMSVGVAYGIWGATGVAAIALLAMVLFDEMLTPGALVGIVLIIIGVVLIETGSSESSQEPSQKPSQGVRA
ncbi:DMT family transporter [Corynebacterium lubricantis]|uniref:DMT family transporter n=1 Tax=Corynebacterium lubricantis TaxID=541095 RepID=UPI000380F1EF|nr:SMR family transporter [Corynebacterium lubricantis]